MIRYKKYQNKNEKNVTTFNKWYARAVCEETVDIAALAEHMSTHNTPFSTGAIHGMLKDMVNCIKELLMDGKNVKIASARRGPSRRRISPRKAISSAYAFVPVPRATSPAPRSS